MDLQRAISDVEECLQKSRYCEAQNIAEGANKRFPEDRKLSILYARALSRAGALDKARERLEGLYRKDSGDPETAGLLGSVYKELWRKTESSAYLRMSCGIYLDGFKNTGNFYPGINAAALSLIIGDKKKSHEIAEEVIRICDPVKDDYWTLATIGEAHIILGRADAAFKFYERAANLSAVKTGDVNSSYRQLKLLSTHTNVPRDIIDLLSPPGIIAFAGHMIDGPGRKRPRFPGEIVEAVKKEIVGELNALDAGISYSSAACGADILFIEAMLERNGEVNILLPFCKDDFIITSVEFAGGQWITRFNNVLEKAHSVKFVTEESYFGQSDLFSFSARVIQGMSILRAAALDTEPTLLAVLDSRETEKKQGGAADTVSSWPLRDNIRIVDPSLIELPIDLISGDGAIRHLESDHNFAIPYGIDRVIKNIIFADIKGFSKMQEEHTPYFMYELLLSLADKMEEMDAKPEILNTWGDAVFAVFDDSARAAEFAFELRDLIIGTDWAKKNLPGGLTIRIALHSGPVFIGDDPIIKRPNAYGAHINRAARMEPVTVAGCIYASEQFAAKLIAETNGIYSLEYVGTIKLHKEYGVQDTYHLRRIGDYQ